MKIVKYTVFLILLLSLGLGCKTDTEIKPKVGFYYWKTNYKISNYESHFLKQINCQTIYLHFFDVDYDISKDKVLPIAILNFSQPKLDSINYVPVVYITQNALNKMKDADLDKMAKNITNMLCQMVDYAHLKVEELQIDCDWTASNKNKYFKLLTEISSQQSILNRHLKLSCTIRLHQIKFKDQVGVPPVNKGMLMCYNMGNLSNANAKNSILNESEALAYLKFLKTYPLALDVALPLFRWTAVFTNGRLNGVLYNFSFENLNNTAIQKMNENKFKVLRDVNIDGYDLYQGQELRVEAPELQTVQNLYTYVKNNLKDHNFTITFYHLDSMALGNNNAANVHRILNEN